MKKVCPLFFLMAHFLILALIGEESFSSKYPIYTKDFILISIPKSGSHLIAEVFARISSNPRRGFIGVKEFRNDEFFFPPHEFVTMPYFNQLRPRIQADAIFAHFNFGRVLWDYAKQHPKITLTINIRDLRDVCVSTVFFLKSGLDKNLGPQATMEERLLHIINSGKVVRGTTFDVKLEAEEALRWMKEPRVLVCRYENLVGPKGGSTQAVQLREIDLIGKALGVQLTDEELALIGEEIYGGSTTFRSGVSGKWKSYFTPKVKKAFKKKLGKKLIAMGYEKTNDW